MRVNTPTPLLLATGAKCAMKRKARSCSWHRTGPWSLLQGLGVGAEAELQKAESKCCLLMLLSPSFRKGLGLALERRLGWMMACASRVPPDLQLWLHVTRNYLPPPPKKCWGVTLSPFYFAIRNPRSHSNSFDLRPSFMHLFSFFRQLILLKGETDGTHLQMSNPCLTWHVYYWIFTRASWPR